MRRYRSSAAAWRSLGSMRQRIRHFGSRAIEQRLESEGRLVDAGEDWGDQGSYGEDDIVEEQDLIELNPLLGQLGQRL